MIQKIKKLLLIIAVIGATYYQTGEIMTIYDFDTEILRVYSRDGKLEACFQCYGRYEPMKKIKCKEDK